MRLRAKRLAAPGWVLLPALFFFLTMSGRAIPAFSRQYQTSCATCHIDFPKLNDFGKAFKDAGFKFPKDDETMLRFRLCCWARQRRRMCGQKRFGRVRSRAYRPSAFAITAFSK